MDPPDSCYLPPVDSAHRYAQANAAALHWMLDRPALPGGWLNTKLHPITLRDATDADPWRGPGTVYGWIQGRGLEALIRHAAFFDAYDRALAARLRAAAAPLYVALSQLVARDGQAFFTYAATDLRPIRPDRSGRPLPQPPTPGIASYTDIFVRKGLLTAAARLAPASAEAHRAALLGIEAAIAEGRFQMEERNRLDDAGALQAARDEYGPAMILLGGSAMMRSLRMDDAGLAARLVARVLARHAVVLGPDRVVLRDAIGHDHCNAGHAIEFVGFALEALEDDAPDELVRTLGSILRTSFELAITPDGLMLSVALPDGRPLVPLCPWWSLPETIRAAALLWERTRAPWAMEIWQRADRIFFERFWRGSPPIAVQTRDATGPVDHVPATPDLDPGYHTGLSLLAAATVARRALDQA